MKSVLLFVSMILPFCIHADEDEKFPISSWEARDSSVDILVETHTVYVASDFDEITYVTAYSLAGDPVWEVSFNSEIHSWKIKDGLLFVFSMAHDEHSYYLTCIDANAGTLLWERAILAPGSAQ